MLATNSTSSDAWLSSPFIFLVSICCSRSRMRMEYTIWDTTGFDVVTSDRGIVESRSPFFQFPHMAHRNLTIMVTFLQLSRLDPNKKMGFLDGRRIPLQLINLFNGTTFHPHCYRSSSNCQRGIGLLAFEEVQSFSFCAEKVIYRIVP